MPTANPWVAVRTAPKFDIWDMPFVGNGYLGLRIAYSGEGREIEDESWYAAYVQCAGLYFDWSRDPAIRMPASVQLPNFLHFEPFIKGLAWRNDPWVEWSDYRQELDFRTSTCTTRYRIAAKDVAVEQRVYAHRTLRHLVVQELTLRAGSQPVHFSTVALNPLGQFKNYTQGVELIRSISVPELNAVIHTCAITGTDQVFTYGERLVVPADWPDQPKAPTGAGPGGRLDRLGGVGFATRLDPAAALTVAKLTACVDSRLLPAEQHEAFVRSALAEVAYADLPGLYDRHAAAWADLWDALPQFEHERLNFHTPALVYILLASMGAGVGASMQVCGLSNTRPWQGKPFRWDQDLFVFPGLIPLFPHAVRDLVEGSFRDPFLARWGEGNDPKSIGTPAVPVRMDWLCTRDRSRAFGSWKMIAACMAKLEQRAEFNATLGQYEIKHGHPADERGPLDADNNILWQCTAWYLVKTALELADVLHEPVPDKWRHMDQAGFFMPFDAQHRRHLEYARWTAGATPPPPREVHVSAEAPPMPFKGGVLTEYYNGHERKQGDVELGYLPLEILTDRSILANDFDYYAPKVTPWGAPEMQNGWFAALEVELGRPERAVGWLEQVCDKWVRGDFRIFTEMQTNYRGLFTTGAGDYLSGLVFGLLGVRLRRDRLHFLPALCPQGLQRIACRKLHLCGALWQVRFALQPDGQIAYDIRELKGDRTFAGTFHRELIIPLA